MTIAAFGTGQVLWSIVALAFFVLAGFLFVTLFADIFRSDELTRWGKALWTLVIIVIPLVGAFAYLVAHGDDMHRRFVKASRRAPADPLGGSTENERMRLSLLRDAGKITAAEYTRAVAGLDS